MIARTLSALACIAALGSCGPSTPSPAEPSSYTSLCAAALVNVQSSTHELGDASLVPIDPKVLSAGPPPRVQCGISEDTYIGAVTFDAICADWQDSSCARVTAAVMNGRVVYVSQAASDAMRQAAHPHRRHRT